MHLIFITLLPACTTQACIDEHAHCTRQSNYRHFFLLNNSVQPPMIRKGTPRQPFPGPKVPFISKILDIGSNDSVQIGFLVTIECRVLQGLPQPSITWFKDGVEVVAAKEQFLLRVNVTTAEDAVGNYSCVASNRAGTDSAFTLLRSGIGGYSGLRALAVSGYSLTWCIYKTETHLSLNKAVSPLAIYT